MDRQNNDSKSRRTGSFSPSSSGGSSLSRHSFSFTKAVAPVKDGDLDSESASEAGDTGDRALHSNKYSGSGRNRLSVDMENGSVVPIPEDARLQSYVLRSRDPILSTAASPVSPSTLDIVSPLSTDAIIHSEDQERENEKELPWLLDYVSCLIHLSIFGILGVLTRFLLQKLFGPGVVGATSDGFYMYPDLPSNMMIGGKLSGLGNFAINLLLHHVVALTIPFKSAATPDGLPYYGSFLMGWFGIVFKRDISRVSDHLAIGLTTGYLGSLTTFSGWNQKMLDLSVEGQWVFVVLGFLIGLFLAAFSIICAVEIAPSVRWVLKKLDVLQLNGFSNSGTNGKIDHYRRQLAAMAVMLLILALLWGISGALAKREFKNGGSEAQLWLACSVGPFGVWIRWFLARLNGHGLGKAGSLKWIPFGTLIANVSAGCVVAALATLKKAVNTKEFDTIANGIQFGLLGNLSTVSAFIAEFHAMRQTNQAWRAYVYALITILTSFGLGILIYSIPVWAKGYN